MDGPGEISRVLILEGRRQNIKKKKKSNYSMRSPQPSRVDFEDGRRRK